MESAPVVSAFELSEIAAVNVERDLAAGLLYSSLRRSLTDFARCLREYRRAVQGDCPAEFDAHLERSYN